MNRVLHSSRALLAGIGLVGTLLLVHGCGQGGIGGSTTGGGPGPKPPPVPILALSANPNVVVVSTTASGSSSLTAQVLDAKTHVPLGGIPVSFFASAGKLASAAVVSDSNGTATDSLAVAAGSSAASIDVSAHAHGAGESLSILVADLAVISLSSSPSFLQCSNGSSGLSLVQALALDTANNPVVGARIAFSASGGGTVSPLATTDVNGQATATVTAPTGLPNGTVTIHAQAAGVTSSISMPVTGCVGLPSPTPTPGGSNSGQFQFLSANPGQIGVLQSGEPEQSTLTFKRTDSGGAPIGGATVDFFVSSLGGESVVPPSAITAGDGTVQTALTAGTRATAVQVTAQTGTFLAISAPITIVGGPPVQGRISASAQFRNIAGNVTSGLIDPVTVLMSDRFSNPVPPGTVVSLQSLGGATHAPSPSDFNGNAVGALIAQAPTNPTDLNGIATGGVATVLALALGETPFIDSNGNGVWDPGETVVAVPEPFFDLNGDGVREANEPFIDLNANGKYDLDQSNGRFSQHVVVFTSTRVTFSGATIASMSPPSGFTIPFGNSQTFLLTLADSFGNPLAAGSSYQVVSSPGGTVARSSGTVPDGQSFGQLIKGLNQFPITVTDSNQVASPVPITLTITVNSPVSATAPGGNGSTSIQINGTMD